LAGPVEFLEFNPFGFGGGEGGDLVDAGGHGSEAVVGDAGEEVEGLELVAVVSEAVECEVVGGKGSSYVNWKPRDAEPVHEGVSQPGGGVGSFKAEGGRLLPGALIFHPRRVVAILSRSHATASRYHSISIHLCIHSSDASCWGLQYFKSVPSYAVY
jgi:hypothetical protein